MKKYIYKEMLEECCHGGTGMNVIISRQKLYKVESKEKSRSEEKSERVSLCVGVAAEGTLKHREQESHSQSKLAN